MRGSRTTFSHFLFKKPLYTQPTFLASPSGKLSASADWRGLCNPSPCLKKIQQTSFFRQKLSTTSCFPLSSTPSPSKAFPPLLFLRCYIPAFVAPALPVRFNPRFSSYPLFSKTISPRNPFAPNRCFRRKHNYYLITFPKTPFIVPRFFILNANICSFFYSITYKTCQHIAIFRKIFHFFIDYFKIILHFYRKSSKKKKIF